MLSDEVEELNFSSEDSIRDYYIDVNTEIPLRKHVDSELDTYNDIMNL